MVTFLLLILSADLLLPAYDIPRGWRHQWCICRKPGPWTLGRLSSQLSFLFNNHLPLSHPFQGGSSIPELGCLLVYNMLHHKSINHLIYKFSSQPDSLLTRRSHFTTMAPQHIQLLLLASLLFLLPPFNVVLYIHQIMIQCHQTQHEQTSVFITTCYNAF